MGSASGKTGLIKRNKEKYVKKLRDVMILQKKGCIMPMSLLHHEFNQGIAPMLKLSYHQFTFFIRTQKTVAIKKVRLTNGNVACEIT